MSSSEWAGAMGSSLRQRVTGWGLCALVCAFGVGCGGGEKVPPLFPVTGKITYQGRPVPGATVIFIPADSAPGPGASKKGGKLPPSTQPVGESDDDGNYTLLWADKHDGAAEGQYKVTITAVEPFAPGQDSEERRPNAIPDRFGNPATSGLTATVKSEDNVINFDLKDQ